MAKNAQVYRYYGYPATLLAMLAIALGMLYYFKRKEWL